MKSQIKLLPEAYGVYVIRHVASGKVYIGSSTNMRQRAYRHYSDLRWSRHANVHLQSAYRRDGDDAFCIEALYQLLDPCLVSVRAAEVALIQEFQACNRAFGYNATSEADASRQSRESIEKMAATKRGKRQSAETIARRVASLTGIKHPPRTQETLVRMSEAQRGKKHSAEHKAKIGEAQRGRLMSDITREKMREIHAKRSAKTRAKLSAALTGKKASAEARAAMSAAKLGKKMAPRSPEHCAKIAQAKRAWWAARKVAELPFIDTLLDPFVIATA